MRGKSHRFLGIHLTHLLPSNTKQLHINAFLLGCIQPDRNPLTYLKGSLRCQWLRGHNYENALRYMERISARLERKTNWNLLDWYTLGKLIHYTADAFTYAHNRACPTCLKIHREYEETLQRHFLKYLQGNPGLDIPAAKTVMEAIREYHETYLALPVNVQTDSQFTLRACHFILATLFTDLPASRWGQRCGASPYCQTER